MSRLFLPLFTVGVVIGCGGAPAGVSDEASPESQLDDEQGALTPLRHIRPVRGTNFNRHRLPGGRTVLKPLDLSATVIEAQVERAGGFDVHPGAGDANGHFEIAGVPRGVHYWLRVGTRFFLTRERKVDVGVDALGRPDATPAAAGTGLVFNVDGLTPVTAGDDFQIEAANAQIGFYSTASGTNAIGANAPAVGDTALTGALFPFEADVAAGTTGFTLIQASRGDTLTLAQLTTRPLGSLSYQSLARALTTPVEMTQGAATAVAGTMTAPPMTVTNLDLRQAGFEALADGIHPGSVPTGTFAAVDPSPGRRRVNLGTPDLAFVVPPAGNGDVVLPLEYGNPYPESWPLFAASGTTFRVPFLGVAEDGTPTQRTTNSTVLAWEFVHRGNVCLKPELSSARDIEIDGQPEAAAIQTTTASPVVTWKRPRNGRPAAYVILVVRVIGTAPFVQRGVARLVVTPDVHRVRIPAGVLQAGEHYYFNIVSVASSQPRRPGDLEILLVPPEAQRVEALSGTLRVE